MIAKGAFSIAYVTPHSGVTGDYVGDNFGIGGVVVKNLIMAVATKASYVPTGVMGIGFDTGESSASSGKVYPNIVDEMVTQKLISTRAYSLWLDDQEADIGTVLFGDYDSDKYSGDLVALDIQPDSLTGKITSMTVVWTSLSVTGSNNNTTFLTSDDFAEPAVLDSGKTVTYVLKDIYKSLASYFGTVESASYGTLTRCNISLYQGTLNYSFGGKDGPIISVPFSELAVPYYDGQGNPLKFDDGSTACEFGLDKSSGGTPIILGDTFLRSAYVVYDLDDTSSNVREISPGVGSLGVALRVASGATAKQTGTASISPGVANTGTATAVPTAAPQPTFGTISGVKTTTAAWDGGRSTATRQNNATTTGQGAATTSSTATAVGRSAFQPWGFVMSCVLMLFGLVTFTLTWFITRPVA